MDLTSTCVVWEISLALDTPIFHNSILNFFKILPFSLKYRFPIRDQKFYFFGHLALFGFAMVKPSGTVAQNLAFFLPQMPEKQQKKCFSCQILRLANIDSWAGLYIIEFSPPPGGGGKIKGSGDGEGNQRGKKEKKRKFGENITFDSTKS